MDRVSKEKIKVLVVGAVFNFFLFLLKVIMGLIFKSYALLSDGIHSLTDLLTDFIGIFATFFSSKPPDKKHRYGHKKYETVGALIVGVFIFIAGFEIFSKAFLKTIELIRSKSGNVPSNFVVYVLLFSILAKGVLYFYTIYYGRKRTSIILVSNAFHHLSDFYSSIAALIGVLVVIVFGEKYSFFDPLSAVFVSFFIFKAGYNVLRDSIEELVDTAIPEGLEDKLIYEIKKIDGVIEPHNLRTRRIGDSFAIELHIRVFSKMSVSEAHSIATKVEEKIKDILGNSTFISVHVEPKV